MQVTDHIHALKIPFQVTAPSGAKLDRFVYAYLIYGKKIHLIDSGVAHSGERISDYIRSTGRDPKEIETLILTHSHPDHIGSAKYIRETTGCTVAAHSAEKSWIEDVDLQFKERPVPGFYSLVEGSVGVDRVLGDGDIVRLEDGLNLKVIHTPGHSAGSVSLLLLEEGALFSGDAILLAGDLPIYDDAVEYACSVETLKSVEGVKILLSSWDDPRSGEQIQQAMDGSLEYLKRINQAVLKVSKSAAEDRCEPEACADPDPMTLARWVLREIGLPEVAANPLISRSFQSNLKNRNKTCTWPLGKSNRCWKNQSSS
jgi:glyoxylase-like metal-dependent hydrolase (beta-lactamase superfamily II)